MNEKPEAWTAIDSFVWPHIAANLIREQHAEVERLREEVRNWKKSFVGHVYVKNEDYAELIGKRDALKTENERLTATALQAQNAAIDLAKENERLREALQGIAEVDLTGCGLPAAGHIAHGLIGRARAALRREETT
jgi:hypothetical protein